MLKKIAAFSLSAALALSPLAALAQTDAAAPAASDANAMPAKEPMKKKTHHTAHKKHMSKEKMEKPMGVRAGSRRARRSSEELIVANISKRSNRPVPGRGGFSMRRGFRRLLRRANLQRTGDGNGDG